MPHCFLLRYVLDGVGEDVLLGAAEEMNVYAGLNTWEQLAEKERSFASLLVGGGARPWQDDTDYAKEQIESLRGCKHTKEDGPPYDDKSDQPVWRQASTNKERLQQRKMMPPRLEPTLVLTPAFRARFEGLCNSGAILPSAAKWVAQDTELKRLRPSATSGELPQFLLSYAAGNMGMRQYLIDNNCHDPRQLDAYITQQSRERTQMQALKRINIDICVRDANNIAAQMWEYVSTKKSVISGRKVFVQFAVGEAGTDANGWAIGIMKIGAKPRVWDLMIEFSDGSLVKAVASKPPVVKFVVFIFLDEYNQPLQNDEEVCLPNQFLNLDAQGKVTFIQSLLNAITQVSGDKTTAGDLITIGGWTLHRIGAKSTSRGDLAPIRGTWTQVLVKVPRDVWAEEAKSELRSCARTKVTEAALKSYMRNLLET